jgi:hypothetical protein
MDALPPDALATAALPVHDEVLEDATVPMPAFPQGGEEG